MASFMQNFNTSFTKLYPLSTPLFEIFVDLGFQLTIIVKDSLNCIKHMYPEEFCIKCKESLHIPYTLPFKSWGIFFFFKEINPLFSKDALNCTKELKLNFLFKET